MAKWNPTIRYTMQQNKTKYNTTQHNTDLGPYNRIATLTLPNKGIIEHAKIIAKRIASGVASTVVGAMRSNPGGIVVAAPHPGGNSNSLCIVGHAFCDRAVAFALEQTRGGGVTPDERTLAP